MRLIAAIDWTGSRALSYMEEIGLGALLFLQVLRGIYHGRPAYPWQRDEGGDGKQRDEGKPRGERKAARERKDASDNGHPRPRTPAADVDVTVEHSAEGRGDLRRLGMD